jgi:hypothetical protein
MSDSSGRVVGHSEVILEIVSDKLPNPDQSSNRKLTHHPNSRRELRRDRNAIEAGLKQNLHGTGFSRLHRADDYQAREK